METAEGPAEFFEEESYVGKSVVIKEHLATDGDQLNLKVGDVVFVLEQDWESGWWGGHKEGDEDTGWFPGTILREPLEPVCARPMQAAAGGPGDEQPVAPAGPQLSPAASTMDVVGRGSSTNSPRPKHAAADAWSSQGDHCWSLPAGDEGCMRDGRMVASPQGPRTTPGSGAPAQGAAAVAMVLARDAGEHSEGLQAEVVRLRAEVAGLHGEVQQLRKQSSADQGRLRELEQLLSDKEQQLKNRASAQSSLSTEAGVLREKLESEKKKSQAQIAANDQMRQRYEEKLREKTEDNMRDKEAARKSIQAEQQRAQSEQRRVKELEQQLTEAHEEVERLRRERQTAKAEGDVSRRLFDAPADRQRGAPPAAVEPPPAQRGRPLPKPAEQQAPRQSPLRPRPWLGHARSTESLSHACSTETLAPEEGPPRGCVFEKVSIFEERCRSQTPRGRDLNESTGEARSASRGRRPDAGRAAGARAVAEQAQKPSSGARLPARAVWQCQELHCPPDDEAGEGQLFMGMSPIHRAPGAASAAPPLAQLPMGAMAVPATWWDPSAGYEVSPSGYSPEAREHTEYSMSRASAAADVSVSEQVRKFQSISTR